MFLFIWYNTNQSPILKAWKLKCEVVFFLYYLQFFTYSSICLMCLLLLMYWAIWYLKRRTLNKDGVMLRYWFFNYYHLLSVNWTDWHSLMTDLIWAEDSWTTLVRSLNTPTTMRTQCQAQSSMNSWDMLLLQSTTRQRLHYLLIDDVVAQDADGILQFLVASPPPPPIVAGHHFREDLTHGVVRLLQRSRLGVQTETKVSHR